MRPFLDASHYASHHAHDSAFDLESRAIFKRLWILAAILPMLAKHNDFRTLTIAGVPLVLQNNSGSIKAFLNVCRHRMATIQTAEFGNRPLVCPYHGWSYDDNGRLQHTNKDARVFGFSDTEMAGIALREFKTAVVGGLVFVNLSDDPLPLDEQFDPAMLAQLAEATSHMDTQYVYTRYDVAFNWKTGIENIKDPLHVQFLHRSTFPESFKFDVADDPALAHAYDRASAGMSLRNATTLTDIVIQDATKHDWHDLVVNLDSKGYYRQFRLFPNVNLMIVDGTSFAIQIYNPVAAGKTEMQMMVALTTPVADFPYKPVVLWEHLSSDMTVLMQDIVCLESMQGNFNATSDEFIHGAYESHILDFQAACLAQMNKVSRS